MKWFTRKSITYKAKLWAPLVNGDTSGRSHNYLIIRENGNRYYSLCQRRQSKSAYYNYIVNEKLKAHLLSIHFDLKSAKAACLLLESTHHAHPQST